MSNKLDRIAAALFIIAGLLAVWSVVENLLTNEPFEWGPLALAALCAFAAIAFWSRDRKTRPSTD